MTRWNFIGIAKLKKKKNSTNGCQFKVVSTRNDQ